MLRAVFFDMGGTLDGDGHWLDRFVELYAQCGMTLPREAVRGAFDEAERRAAADDVIATAGVDAMVARHVAWQFDHLYRELGGDTPGRPNDMASHSRDAIVERFVASMRLAAVANTRMLAGLQERGLQLGIVSNGCGNVNVLCDDLGYSPYLSLVVDSRRVGLSKPDPAIYTHAAATLGLPPAAIMMVGDSFARDVRPAKSVGMKTAWLSRAGQECPDPACVDVPLRTLADLPGALHTRALFVA